MKSEKDGPVLSLSAKIVGFTRGLVVGESVMEGSVAAVAKDREGLDVETGSRKTLNGDGEVWP